MRCPRCDDPLTTYALGGGEDAAVVCETCGYADVPASHYSDADPPETWDDALERFEDGAEEFVAALQRTASEVSVPDVDSGERTTIDGDRLEETTVSVASALRRSDDGASDDVNEEFRLVGGDNGDGATAEETPDEADSDGDEADSESDEADSDGDEADSESDEADSDGDEADSEGNEADSDNGDSGGADTADSEGNEDDAPTPEGDATRESAGGEATESDDDSPGDE
jgi:hypothetical protein